MIYKGLKISLLILFVLLHFNSFSQAFNDIEWYDVDSLLKVLPDQYGKDKMKTLNALAASLSFENKEQCRYYAGQALSMAEKLNDPEGIAAANRNLGRMEFYDGNYPKALNYYQESLNIYEILGNSYFVAQLLEDIGTTHFFARNFDKAFELIQEVLAVYRSQDSKGKTIGDVRDTMSIYSRVGLPYRRIGRSDIAKTIYLNYIRIGEKHRFEVTDMMVHNGLLAMCYYEIGNSDSAFYYFRQAADFPDANMSILALKYEFMRRRARIHLELGNTDTAISLFKRSYQWLSERGFLKQSQLAARQLGDIFVNTNRINLAEFYYRRSEDLLNEMIKKGSYYRYDSLKYTVSYGSELYLPFTKKLMKEEIYEEAIPLYEHIYKLYLSKEQLSRAMTYLIACSNTKDTLRKLTINREYVEIQTRYESERKDTEIVSLSQKNELKELQLLQTRWFLVGLGGLLILILLLAIILIRQNKLRNSQQTLLFQQRLFRTQMNPHFLFNSLASIQNFIIKEKPTEASDYLSRFSKLVRQILNNSVEEYIPLEDEVNSIENYLELQKIRHRDMFDYTLEVDEEFDMETTLIPPMLAQPFIENSIEHGFKHKEGKGNMKIRFRLNGRLICFELEDDGVGREKALQIMQSQNKNHQSMSTEINRQRIIALNRKLKRKITLDIIDLKDEFGKAAGTKVIILIPENFNITHYRTNSQ